MSASFRYHPAYLPVVSGVMTVAVFLTISGLRRGGLLEPLDVHTYDALLRTQRTDGFYSPRIVVIGIDEADIQSGKFHYPIYDDELADILQKVIDCGPRVVGVDIFRDMPVPTPAEGKTPAGRERLRRLWRDQKNIIQVYLSENDIHGKNQIVVRPPEGLDEDQTGFAEYVVDDDGISRRGLLFEAGEDPASPNSTKVFSSFTLQLIETYLAGESPPLGLAPIPGADPKDLSLGHAHLRHFHGDDGPFTHGDDRGISFLLDFKSDGNFLHLTGSQVLSGTFAKDALKDALVLIGMRASSVKDSIATPMRADVSGVDLHAATLDQLMRMAIRGDPQLRFQPPWVYAALTFTWCTAGGLLGYSVRRPRLQLGLAALGLAIIIACTWIAFRFAWWIPGVEPALGLIFSAAIVGLHVSYHERSDRLLLQKLFATQASSHVADILWKRRQEFLEHGRIKPRNIQATIMFTDLRGFAKVVEQLQGGESIDWINHLMDPMSQVVEKHHGMIRQFSGDTIMALFGVPLSGPKGVEGNARDAVFCALEMRRCLQQINEQFRVHGKTETEMRIGICTGDVVAGSIGGQARMEFTVVGDPVNIASRLESFKKELQDPDIAAAGCRILIDGQTNAFLNGHVRTRFVDEAALTGTVKIRIFGVIDQSPLL